MPESKTEHSHRLEAEQQDQVLRLALETEPNREAAQYMRQLLSHKGVMLVFLGQLQRARDICKEKMITADLADERTRMRMLQLQGQAQGVLLAIETVFEIANFGTETED